MKNKKADDLIKRMRSMRKVVVAFSGGVDSSVVAAAGFAALSDQAIAVTAISPSVASWQRTMAERIAREIGIEHRTVQTNEMDLADYRRNDSRRCYFCKQALYQSLESILASFADYSIVSGTNADDLGDYRPGLKAGREQNVQTPLADLGYSKQDVRDLANHFGLTNHQTPASPCLASRIAYGIEVTPQRLLLVDQCESWLRDRGFEDVRVRIEPPKRESSQVETAAEHARIEVPLADIDRLNRLQSRGELGRFFEGKPVGSYAVDPRGLRSGNLNDALNHHVQLPNVVQLTAQIAPRRQPHQQ